MARPKSPSQENIGWMAADFSPGSKKFLGEFVSLDFSGLVGALAQQVFHVAAMGPPGQLTHLRW